MIFFSNKSGQLGNRLFSFGHLIANAAANNTRVVNLSFDEYARYFQTTSTDVLCRYPRAISVLRSDRLRSWLFVINKAVFKLLRITRAHNSFLHSIVIADLPEYQFKDSRYFNLNEPSFQQGLGAKPAVFLFGRFFRDYRNFEKYQDVIRDFFKPIAVLQNNIDQYTSVAKADVDLVIGVHIRRGDYEQFAEGKYFYSDAQYAFAMRTLQESIKQKRIRFVICSNEPVQLDNFNGVAAIKGPGHLVEDMYVLSACDYIMGPPSTFTLWASFYGKKPLYQVRKPDQAIALDNFVMLPPVVLYNFSFN